MTYVIIKINLKGGVGKTTGSIELTDRLAAMGFTVLYVDGDQDRCGTETLDLVQKDDGPDLYTVLTNVSSGIAGVVKTYKGTAEHPINYKGRFDVIPGSKRVNRAPATFASTIGRQPVSHFGAVGNYFITHFCQGYDFVVIDGSPSDGMVTQTLLNASNGAIAPVPPEVMPKRGALNLFDIIQASNEERATYEISHQTALLGVLISKVIPGQEQMAQDFASLLDRNKIPRFQAIIPFTMAACTAPGECLPINQFAPQDAAAIAYANMTQEVVRLVHA